MKKKIMIALLSVFLVGNVPINSFAAEESIVSDGISVASASNSYVIQKTVIITKYRVVNGKLQYRHWDVTMGKWVEPDWIDA